MTEDKETCDRCDRPVTCIIHGDPKMHLCKDHFHAYCEFLKTPMGAGQWMAHGKKYGYWDYFEKETAKRCLKLVNDELGKLDREEISVLDLPKAIRQEFNLD